MKKTKKLLTGIISAAMVTVGSGCGQQSLPPLPEDENCKDWEWEDDEGVWECDDDDSTYYGHYFYGGKYYSTKKLLSASSAYKSYKSSSSFKGSSGFGSGSKGGFGG